MADEQEITEEVEEVEVKETVWEDLLLKCGVTLRMRPVGMPAIRNLVKQVGGWSMLTKPEKMLELSDEERRTSDIASNQLFLYAAGWGVETDPPPEAEEELAALGWTAMSKKLTRARWLRYLVLEEAEIGTLLGRVMFLSMRNDKSKSGEDENE